jgi:hypothetical protein
MIIISKVNKHLLSPQEKTDQTRPVSLLTPQRLSQGCIVFTMKGERPIKIFGSPPPLKEKYYI